MRILLFIVLKIAELGALTFIPYWIGLLLLKIFDCHGNTKTETWGIGLIGLVVIFMILIPFIYLNWRLAGNILGL